MPDDESNEADSLQRDPRSTKRLYGALAIYVVLGVFSSLTLEGNIRLATLIFLGGLAFKTYLAYLQRP